MKIRSDLVGVAYVYDVHGTPTMLAAGDEIPEGASIGAHLLDSTADNGPAEIERPADSGPGSSRSKWLAYAEHLGVTHDHDASRDDIIAAVDAHQP